MCSRVSLWMKERKALHWTYKNTSGQYRHFTLSGFLVTGWWLTIVKWFHTSDLGRIWKMKRMRIPETHRDTYHWAQVTYTATLYATTGRILPHNLICRRVEGEDNRRQTHIPLTGWIHTGPKNFQQSNNQVISAPGLLGVGACVSVQRCVRHIMLIWARYAIQSHPQSLGFQSKITPCLIQY